VRCAKCGHSWQQTPPADMPRQIDADGPPVGLVSLPQIQPVERRWSRGLGLPLMVILLVLLALGGGYFFRDPVVARWPQAAQLYELIGVATRAGQPLELDNVSYARQEAGADTLLQIQGEIYNPTNAELPLPQLKASLRSESGKLLREWTFDADRPTIRPGEIIPFKTDTRNPPADATKLGVDLLPR
jgi:hypothetical protein